MYNFVTYVLFYTTWLLVEFFLRFWVDFFRFASFCPLTTATRCQNAYFFPELIHANLGIFVEIVFLGCCLLQILSFQSLFC